LHLVERKQLDAFPSGHTALSLLYLVLGWRLLPRWRLPLTALTAGIIFSTVYLSLHYVVDLLAGALVAAVMLLAAPPLHRALERRPAGEWRESPHQRPSSNAHQPPAVQPIRSKRPPR